MGASGRPNPCHPDRRRQPRPNLYDDAVGNLLLRPLRLWVMYLPQLAACYLLGLLGRNIVIELAAKFGWNNYLVVDLLMPFAGIIRLGSIVAMFLVLKSAIPVLAVLPKASLRSMDIFANIVLPFFVIYLAWKMFQDDWLAYERRAMPYRIAASWNGQHVTDELGHLPLTNTVWYLIVGAFIVRYLMKLKWVKAHTPSWFVFIQVYLDALWVFLALSFAASKGVTFFLNPAGWFKERRIVVWVETMRAELFSHFRPLEIVWNLLIGVWDIAWGAAAVPLIWLAIAGIIYGSTSRASWRGALRRVAGVRGDSVVDRLLPARERVQSGLTVLSDQTKDKTKELALSQFGRARPIIDSARLVLHGGLIILSAYIFAYMCLSWLDMSDSFLRAQRQEGGFLTRGFAWLFGPHPAYFWDAVSPVLVALTGVLIGSLRICLIASVFAHCVERAEAEVIEADAPDPTAGDVVDYPDDHAASAAGKSAGSIDTNSPFL